MAIELSEMTGPLASALADGCPVVGASVDERHSPKMSFYGSIHVHSATQLAIWVRNPESGVLGRIANNPRMSFLYRNPEARLFWQFFGSGRVEGDAAIRDAVYAAIPEIERLLDPDTKGTAVIVDVDRVTGRGLDMRAD